MRFVFDNISSSLRFDLIWILCSSLTSLSSALLTGRRRDPGDQRREHKRHEARAGHRAHQERRPPCPSGAQKGRRLRA